MTALRFSWNFEIQSHSDQSKITYSKYFITMKNKYGLNNEIKTINCLQKFLIPFFIFLAFGFQANAQLYTRTTFNAVYVPITIGGGATVSTATGNDVNQTAIPLGFTLNYAGVNYSTVGLNTNGLLWFDAVAPTATEGRTTSRLYSTLAPNQCITAWMTDMNDDALSDILYQTQGSPGNRTFTVQYTNYPHYTGTIGTNIRLNIQIVFYEASNVIELRYGSSTVTGPPATAGGASIVIEYGTGGARNFIDMVTGSGQTSHGMLSPLSAWPSYNYRLTPGTPAPVAAGTYNVGIGQTYPSLTLATSDLNHRGISGPVTLNLTDNNYDTSAANGSHIFPVFVGPFKGSSSVNTVTISKTGTPAIFSYRGSPVLAGNFGYGSTGGLSGISDSEEPIMGVCSRYTTISNINLVSLGTTANDVEVGLMVFESFGGDSGAQHNVFDKISVNMDRNNSSTIGIFSNNMTNPGGFQGSNSFNTYRDITIRDCYAGIYLQGAGGVYEPDAGNQIISSSCTTFNSIGDPAVPNDIGGGSVTYGIWLSAQNSFKVRNTIIRNISTTSATSSIDGILVSSGKGVCEISNNIIRAIKRNNTGAGSTYILTGIRLSHSNSVNDFRIFNNSISDLSTNYTGAATASYAVRGIYFDDTGAGTNTFNIWNNSISIDGSTFPNASNTCIQFLQGVNFTVNMKNNVLANFTSTQTGAANHYCIITSNVDRYGLINSLSNYNDLYIANGQGTSGHVGRGASTNYSTLSAWQSGMSFNAGTDANSNSANPFFVNNNSDLHGTPLSTAINGTGTTPPGFAGIDIDCEPRNFPYDKGFDDFTYNVLVLNLGIFIEGFYARNGLMNPVLANSGEDVHPDIADSIIVELRNSGSPYLIEESKTVLLKTNGDAIVYLPLSFSGGSYYIAVKNRNAVETWSKLPVTFGAVTNFNFN